MHWTVNMTKVAIGKQLIESSSNHAILDTGTSFTLLPAADFEQVLAYIKSVKECFKYPDFPLHHFCKCDTLEDIKLFPTFTVTLGLAE